MSHQGKGRRPVRLLASLVTGCGLALAVVFAAGAAPAPDQVSGQQLYGQYCAACHQADGAGVAGVFPPLAGSDWVTGDPARLVRVLLHGLSGPIMVQGEEFNSLMPAWGGALQDGQIAAVATYVRTSFGHTATPITEAEVARLRSAHAGRTAPWTAQELSTLAPATAAK